jgi:hypothetical protein
MQGNDFTIGDRADALVERAGGIIDLPGVRLDLGDIDPGKLGVGGYFVIECFDAGGNLRWEDTAENGVVNLALNDVLNVYLRNTAATANWYIGLVDNASFTGFAAADTVAAHSGWVENTNYSNPTRVQWSPGAASNQGVTNSVTADFNMTPVSPVTIKGLFLCSDNTKGGTGGLLFATAAFTGGNQTVNNGDTLKVTYTVNASST